MGSRPWMPLWVADYLTDTAHLTAAESGAYIHLIIFYWVNGGLPSDENAIARITRLRPIAWEHSRGTLKALFKGGHWKHPRIDAEIAKAIEISQVNSANAKRRHYGRGNGRIPSADTPTPTPTYKKGNSEKSRNGNDEDSFKAKPGSKEFEAWKGHYEKISNAAMLRELSSRELEGRSYDFPCQWPPEH